MYAFRVSGYNNHACLSFDVSLFRKEAGRLHVVQPVNLAVEILNEEDQHRVFGPTFRFDYDTAQNLFQEMWNQGYRPANGSSGAAEVDALKAHIAFAEKIALRNR